MIKPRKSWLALALAAVASFEGMRTTAYEDPVGIPTICFGYIKGVQLGDTATPQQCQALLTNQVAKYGQAVMQAVTVPLSRSELAAYTSFTYNVGIKAFQRSTLLQKLNSGNHIGACNELPRWVYAHGLKLPGLIKRRERERKLCLSELEE